MPFLSEGEIKKNQLEEEKELMLERQKSLGSRQNEDDIKSLIGMGFTRNQVVEALSICDGVKEHAAQYLMNQRGGQSP